MKFFGSLILQLEEKFQGQDLIVFDLMYERFDLESFFSGW